MYSLCVRAFFSVGLYLKKRLINIVTASWKWKRFFPATVVWKKNIYLKYPLLAHVIIKIISIFIQNKLYIQSVQPKDQAIKSVISLPLKLWIVLYGFCYYKQIFFSIQSVNYPNKFQRNQMIPHAFHMRQINGNVLQQQRKKGEMTHSRRKKIFKKAISGWWSVWELIESLNMHWRIWITTEISFAKKIAILSQLVRNVKAETVCISEILFHLG